MMNVNTMQKNTMTIGSNTFANPNMSKHRKFLIIDDHPIFSIGFEMSLKGLYSDAIVQKCASTQEASTLIDQAFDIIFVEHQLRDGKDGLLYIQHCLSENQTQRFVLMSSESYVIEQYRALGLSGTISKYLSPEELKYACEKLLSGDDYFDTSMIPKDLSPKSKKPGESNYYNLTVKEVLVLDHLKSGHINKTLAENLNISESTLRTHLRSIFRKMDVSNRTECVTKAIDMGII